MTIFLLQLFYFNFFCLATSFIKIELGGRERVICDDKFWALSCMGANVWKKEFRGGGRMELISNPICHPLL